MNYKIGVFTAMGMLALLVSCTTKPELRTHISDILNQIDTLSYTQPEKAIHIIDSTLNNSESLTALEKTKLTFNKGEILFLNDNYIDAINTQLSTLEAFKSLNESYYVGNCLITLSSAYLHLQAFDKSQEYALQALNVAQEIKHEKLLSKAYNRLFYLHFHLKDYSQALQYITKSDSLITKSTDTTSIIATKSNIASLYLQLKQYNKALENYALAMNLSRHSSDVKTLVTVLNNIGFTYIEAGDLDSAKKFLKGAATLNKNINSINAAPFKGLGNVFLLDQQLDSASYYYHHALTAYHQNSNFKDKVEVYDKLVAIAILEQDFQKALSAQKKRDSIQRIITATEKDQLLSFANVKYEVKKQETELQYQKEINNANRLLFISIALSLLLLLITLIVFYVNLKLHSKNKASALEQKLLRAQMNPHFIFNALAAIQNITLEGDPLKSSQHIAKFAKLIRQNFDYVRKDKISLDKEISMITNYIETQRLRFNNVFNYQIDISGVDDSTKVFIPPMLLQPFVENAIEYGVKDKKDTLGLVTICIRKEGSSLFFSIEDNGVGRNEASKHKRISETEHATDVFLERLNRRKKKKNSPLPLRIYIIPMANP